MARLWSSGSELNLLNTVELDAGGGNTTSQTTTTRSGTYTVRVNPSASTAFNSQSYRSSDTAEDVYFRFYLRIATLPGGTIGIFSVMGTALRTVLIRLTAAGALQLYNAEDGAQVGSDSSALSTNTWYRIELRVNGTTISSTALDARINGVSFASGTVNLADSKRRIQFGVFDSATTELFFDDFAINSSSGSFQNSWPGSGKIVHLRPNAAGDASDWTNTYTNVDEVAPDDAITLVSSNTLDQIDDHNVDAPSQIGTTATINVVQVGVRFNGVGASANASFVLRVKASASGTVEESGAITPSDTTWVTNAAALPRNYSLTLYDLPGASTTAWTSTDLASAQIGYRLSATSTNAAQISTVWLLVDYTPFQKLPLTLYHPLRMTAAPVIRCHTQSVPATTVCSSFTPQKKRTTHLGLLLALLMTA